MRKKVLPGELEEKSPFGRRRPRWEDNITICMDEIGRELD
jgi:hypothetical protein